MTAETSDGGVLVQTRLVDPSRVEKTSCEAHLISSSLTSNVSWLLPGIPGIALEP